MSNLTRTIPDGDASLLDPFNSSMIQPKLSDGKAARSAGLRLRATGQITCNSTGSTYFALIPGLSNAICWRVDDDPATPEVAPPPFLGHLDSVFDREKVKMVRTVGTALRLSLVNSADQKEGYWEAARIPTSALDFKFHEPDPVGAPGVTNSAVSLTIGEIDLSNYGSYMTGKVREIHNYQFKLNAIDNKIDFSRILVEPPSINEFVSEQWDTIIIKINGQVATGTPSEMMYDCISSQEVIYQENTSLARLMTPSPFSPQSVNLLARTRLVTPASKIV